MSIDIGKRLKEIRKSKGLSQRQLASRSGVTNGSISMIEMNRTSPSVASLKKVLEGIPMSLSEFFSVEEQEAEQYFFTKGELKELSPAILSAIGINGNIDQVSIKQVGDASRHSLQILYECYPPGADTGKDMITHEAEEGGIIVSGEIEVTVDNQVQILKAGDSYLFDSRLKHRFRNISTGDCIIISACTPPSF
ncbi:cupin domain-containing protein [Sedimenticola sp.]|uniref:cupin domain-containing protein n=1 Tax=Sedimenticola sp. TaxID=1940285 RepID=UPI003D0D5E21